MADAKRNVTQSEGLRPPLASGYKTPVWMMRCKYYMLEFILALIAILASAFVLDRTFFALGHYTAGLGTTAGYDNMNLMIVAMGIVWLPTAILFFKRSRFEELNRPEVASTKLRRFFLYAFMLLVAVSAIGFKIAAIYSLLQVAFGAEDVKETLIATTVPAILAAWVHAYVFWTFMKPVSMARIKQFTTFFGGVGIVLVLALFAVTAIQAKDAIVDERISEDLSTIHQQVGEHYGRTGNLPENFDQLSLDDDVKSSIGKYSITYEKQNGRDYKLCANFKGESKGDGKPRIMIYPPTPDFTEHKKGNHCFELSAGYDYFPAAVDGMEEGQGSSGSAGALDTLESLWEQGGGTATEADLY